MLLSRVNMNLNNLQLEEMSEQTDPYTIKNFIVSDLSSMRGRLPFGCPFTINGLIFAICVQGSAHIRLNFEEYHLEKNMIVIILPYFVAEYLWKSDDLKMEYLMFSPELIAKMLKPTNTNINISRSLIQTPCLKLSEKDVDEYLEIHSFIVKQYKRREHPFRAVLVESLIYTMLVEVGAIYYNKYLKDSAPKQDVAAHRKDIVPHFFRLLIECHKQERDLRFYAGKMALTPKYLSTVIKSRTGKTACAWISELVVTSIKYSLKATNMTVSQISYELNFPNPSYFGRFFKKHTGMTPLEYKENNGG